MIAARPNSVIAFERVFAAMILVQIGYAGLDWLEPGGWLASLPYLSRGQQLYVVVASVSGLLIYCALLYFAARQASRVARAFIVAAAFFRILGVGRHVWLIPGIEWSNGLRLVALSLHLWAIWLLLRSDANRWFRKLEPVEVDIFR